MASPPDRPSGRIPFGSPRVAGPQPAEALHARVRGRLAERLDPARLKRLPPSFAHQEVCRLIETILDSEAPQLSRWERDQLIDELVHDTLGFGPLEELFNDTSVREILILGPQTVLCRKKELPEEQAWLPTNVRFRDREHLQHILDKARSQAEPLTAWRPPTAACDVQMENGFRLIAITPPPLLNLPSYVVFVRGEGDGLSPKARSGFVPLSATHRPASPSPPQHPPPPPALEPQPESDALATLRDRITEHIRARLASHGVADPRRLELRDLHRVIAAYVQEFTASESLSLEDDLHKRLVQEILAQLR